MLLLLKMQRIICHCDYLTQDSYFPSIVRTLELKYFQSLQHTRKISSSNKWYNSSQSALVCEKTVNVSEFNGYVMKQYLPWPFLEIWKCHFIVYARMKERIVQNILRPKTPQFLNWLENLQRKKKKTSNNDLLLGIHHTQWLVYRHYIRTNVCKIYYAGVTH